MANEIANLFGFSLPEFDYSGLKGLAATGDDAADSLGGAADAAKDLKNAMLGIDELNVISPNMANGGAGGGTAGGGDLGLKLPEYDFLGDLIENKSNALAEKLEGPFKTILSLVGSIGAAMLLWKIGDSVITFMNWVKS